MPKHGKKYHQAREKLPDDKTSIEEGVRWVKEVAFANFDETVEVATRLGVNPKHADQIVRGSVVLPHGTGKEAVVLVFAEGEKAEEARAAGADYVGDDEFIQKIQGGWLEFDACVATPNMMSKVGRLGRILGPRGLMPNPKSGTVTFDVAATIRDIKAGRVEFRTDRVGNIHAPVGRVSFSEEQLTRNIDALFETLARAKPAAAKGRYFRSAALSSTMGPAVRLDEVELANRYRS